MITDNAIWNEVFKYTFYFSTGSEEDFVDEYNDIADDEEKEATGRSGYCLSDNASEYVYLYIKSVKDLGAVSHEVFHAVSTCLSHRGITPQSEDGEETYAYMVEWLTNRILEVNNGS